MKKTCVFALATILAMPAFAAPETTNAVVADMTTEANQEVVALENNVATNALEQVKYEPSNPKIKFPHGLQLGVGLSSTSGVNGFVGYNNKKFDSFWWKRLGVRFDFASTKPVKSVINNMIDKYMGDGIEVGDDVTITDGKIESRHMAALIDIYPFGDTWFLGGWRLTGGYVFGEMNVKAMLTGKDDTLAQYAGKEFQLGGNVWKYTPGTAGDVHGTAKASWDIKGPYAGTGFDLGLFRGFKIFLDAGVVFTNKAAELSLDIPYDAVSAVLEYRPVGSTGPWTQIATAGLINTAVETTLKNDIEDAISDAQKEVDKYKFFPIVKLGFMYRF